MNPIVTRLNRIPGKVMPVVNVNQYDKSNASLLFEIFDGDVPFELAGLGASILGTKPDKTGFSYGATVTGTNEVTADLEQQMTVIAGDVVCELRFVDTQMIQGTLNFILRVEPAALADDTVISETELPMIEHAAEVAAQMVSYMEDARQSAEEAEQSNQDVQHRAATITQTVTNSVRSELQTIVDRSHTQFLHILPVTGNGWVLQSGGTWDGYYANEISITNIYNDSAHVRASGTSIDLPPSDEVKSAVSVMYFELDDTNMKLTAYTKTAPEVDVYISVEGVQ